MKVCSARGQNRVRRSDHRKQSNSRVQGELFCSAHHSGFCNVGNQARDVCCIGQRRAGRRPYTGCVDTDIGAGAQ